jgi:hypothetical protein
MGYEITEFNYEGEAEVYCSKCETSYTIEFNGDDSIPKIKDAIKESLLGLGWTDTDCPECAELEENENGDD